jgi:hypothetical protein
MAHLEEGYTMLATQIFTDLAGAGLTGAQWDVLSVIFFSTYGQVERNQDSTIKLDGAGRPIKKRMAKITVPEFMQHTGLSRRGVLKALEGLAARNIINREAQAGLPGFYGYQKYAEKWEPVHKGAPVHGHAPVNGSAQEWCTAVHGGGEPQCTGVVHGSSPIINNNKVKVKEAPPPVKKKKLDGPLPLAESMARYDLAQQLVVEEYWATIRKTRKRGTLAESVKATMLDKWHKAPAATVIKAMQIHIAKHQGKREEYTSGIIRGLMQEGGKTDEPTAEPGFDIARFTFTE